MTIFVIVTMGNVDKILKYKKRGSLIYVTGRILSANKWGII